jgi:hypothetical protein
MGYTLERMPSWLGRFPMLDTTHADDLEMRAAINEHHYGMPRAQAEEKAHSDYRRDKIVEAAAHHLNGMTAAHSIGHMDEAQKHAVMYALALHQLGHKDLVSPPDDVSKRAKNTPSTDIAHFKAHPGDAFSTPPNPSAAPPRGKLEPDVKREAQKMRESQMAKAEGSQLYDEYPEDHKLGMRVAKGGSMCANCSYVSEDLKKCGNETFQKFNGGDELPAPADEYCCDLYQIGGKSEG